MTASYNGFTASNTNGNARQPSVVRVYNADMKMIAEQHINKRNPLGYVRGCVKSKHIDQLWQQCKEGGMDAETFNFIFHCEVSA